MPDHKLHQRVIAAKVDLAAVGQLRECLPFGGSKGSCKPGVACRIERPSPAFQDVSGKGRTRGALTGRDRLDETYAVDQRRILESS